MPGILCSGNLVLDILVRPVERVIWGTTSRVESISQHLGGNGGNTSYTLARLGVPVRVLGMVGRDAFGEFILDKLRAAGADIAPVSYSEAPTSVTVGLIDPDGRRLFLHRLGSSQELFEGNEEFRGALAGMTHYHLGSPFGVPRLRPKMPEVLREARAAGLSTSLDTMWDALGGWMEDLGPCLPHVDLLFLNEDEAIALTGAATASAAAVRLRGRGARDVVFKLGGNGCAVLAAAGNFQCPAFDVPVVDTTGAGDSFVGGFLAARQRGYRYEEAARIACATAALNIRQVGGSEGARGFEETLRWLSDAPVRPIAPDALHAGAGPAA